MKFLKQWRKNFQGHDVVPEAIGKTEWRDRSDYFLYFNVDFVIFVKLLGLSVSISSSRECNV